MNQFRKAIVDAFSQFWDERQPRERQYILAALVVLVVSLIYLIGIDPALTGRDEMRRQLPQLRLQSIEIKQMAQELQTLPGPENLRDVDRDSIATSLAQNNLNTDSLTVIDGIVRLQINSTSVALLQTWLLEMQKTFGLFVREIKLTGLDGGLVGVTLTMQQSTAGG